MPVLPFKTEINGAEKLLFPLCRSCIGDQRNSCKHSDTQRSIIGTWTSFELDKAIQKGYKIMKTYEICHWNNWSTDMFKGYIKKFMQIKQEALGYPDSATTDEKKQNTLKTLRKKQVFK